MCWISPSTYFVPVLCQALGMEGFLKRHRPGTRSPLRWSAVNGLSDRKRLPWKLGRGAGLSPYRKQRGGGSELYFKNWAKGGESGELVMWLQENLLCGSLTLKILATKRKQVRGVIENYITRWIRIILYSLITTYIFIITVIHWSMHSLITFVFSSYVRTKWRIYVSFQETCYLEAWVLGV